AVLSILDEDGEDVGEINALVDGDRLLIKNATVDPSAQGQGLGTRAYRALIDQAFDRGLEVYSDSELTPSGNRTYRRLKREGHYEVVRWSDARPREDGGLQGPDHEPVYRVFPKGTPAEE